MGNPLTVLAEADLPPRKPWSSMILADLCENIHIHHRDLRTEFSIPEFLEYVAKVERSRDALLRYLKANPEYEEGAYPDTVLKLDAGASVIEESPQPYRSAYFPDRLLIQLEKPGEAEIHVHWRDRRMDLDREQLRVFADAFGEAVKRLDEWEAAHGYEPKTPLTLAEVRKTQEHRWPQPGPGHFKELTEE